jgi:hypothetical protein
LRGSGIQNAKLKSPGARRWDEKFVIRRARLN